MSAHKLIAITLATAGVLAGVMALQGAMATAETAHPLIGSFGPEGPGTGSFAKPESVAVDQSTGDVYVYDVSAAAIYKFDSAGDPVDFSALGTNKLTGSSTPRGDFGTFSFYPSNAQVAVDDSGGPADGDIYVTDYLGKVVDVFAATGAYLGQLTGSGGAGETWGYPCGVSVDGAGNVYVGLISGEVVDKFTPSGSPVVDSDYVASLQGAGDNCQLAVDSAGDVYTSAWSPAGGGTLSEYAPGQLFAGTSTGTSNGAPIDASGVFAIATDPFDLGTQDVYADEGTDIAVYSPAGALQGKFGESGSGSLESSDGVAVNGTSGLPGSGDVYASDTGASTVDIFGADTVPDVTTGAAALNVTATSATLTGVVDADGTSAASYYFQYGLSTTYEAASPAPPGTSFAGSSALPASVTLTGLRPNTIYHYRLDATNSSGLVDMGQDQTFATPSIAPTVDERAPLALDVTPTSAVLSGTIDPENSQTVYHFVYGRTAGYGSSGPEQRAGGAFGERTVQELIGGLEPDTTYHYALVATNQAGSVTGPDETFTTGALTAPALSVGAVSEVTQTTATLTGTVDTFGLYTSAYGFSLGTDTNYTSAFVVGSAEAGVTGSRPVTVTVQGLEPGTTYHYRMFATSSDGPAYSSDETFTTAGTPNPSSVLDTLTVPATEPLISSPTIAFPAEATSPIVKAHRQGSAKKAKRKRKVHRKAKQGRKKKR
jgi:hypothetical protein